MLTQILTLLLVLGVATLSGTLFIGCSDDASAPTFAEVSDDFSVEDPLDASLRTSQTGSAETQRSRILWLIEELGLTDEQAEAISAAYTVFHDGISALRDSVREGEITWEEARAQAAVLREAFEADLQLILTEEQWATLQDLRDNHGHGNDGDSLEDRFIEWLGAVGADEAQIEAALAAVETLKVEAAAIRDAVHAGEMTRDEAREALLALRADFFAALQDILTEEQYAALLELLPDRPCDGPRDQCGDHDGEHHGDQDGEHHGDHHGNPDGGRG